MRILRNKNHKKTLIIIGILVLLLSGTAAAALFIPISPFAVNKDTSDQPENTVNYDKPTAEQIEAGNTAKEEFIKAQDEKDAAENTPEDSASATTVGVSIATLAQEGSTLQIRTIIEESTGAVGNCTLTLSRTGYDSVAQTAPTQSQGSYSVCQGFDVDVSALAAGSWTVKIDYVAKNKTGTVQKAVTLQ